MKSKIPGTFSHCFRLMDPWKLNFPLKPKDELRREGKTRYPELRMGAILSKSVAWLQYSAHMARGTRSLQFADYKMDKMAILLIQCMRSRVIGNMQKERIEANRKLPSDYDELNHI